MCGSSGPPESSSEVVMMKARVRGIVDTHRSVRVALALTLAAATAGLAVGPASVAAVTRTPGLGTADEAERVTVDVTVKEYDASGARLRSTYSSGELAPGYTTSNVASAVHARTGCHTIAIRTTGWSLLGFIMWR